MNARLKYFEQWEVENQRRYEVLVWKLRRNLRSSIERFATNVSLMGFVFWRILKVNLAWAGLVTSAVFRLVFESSERIDERWRNELSRIRLW